MEKTALHRVTDYKNRWLISYLIETIFLSAAIFCVALLISIFALPEQAYMISIALFIFSLPILFFFRRYQRISVTNVLRLLSLQNPDLQHSADLLLEDPSSLTRLEQLQKRYINEILLRKQLKFIIPHQLKMAFTVMVLCFGAYMSSLYFESNTTDLSILSIDIQQDKNDQALLTSPKQGIKDLQVTVIPPTYTKHKREAQETWDMVVPEGALIRWDLSFHEEITQGKIRFSDKTELVLKKKGTRFLAATRVDNRVLYELIYKDSAGNTVYSDFHKIDIVYDMPPQVSVSGIDQFSEHEYSGDKKFDLKVSLSDDHGISDAYIIATIAQGTGESVMFREEKIKFDAPIRSNIKSTILPKHFNLETFGMQPGDELYFYVEAKDNCTFKQNITRTETYIISIRDTATYVSDMEGGLGIDLMPEYFRSQRQIIIDTEKLLKNKPNLTAHDFNATSNELGFDQKSLRLKYGQFLGEEDESGIAIEDHGLEEEEHISEEEGGEHEDALDGFKHDHDNEDEHERMNEGEAQEDPLEDFKHAHDSEEVVTFFSNTLKGKLKAAMALMWDSELYLRLYQPEKSLPYQYKALKLIKEIKNHARVYVHRIGFDPPPIKEESRLSADLSEVMNNRLQVYDTIKAYPAIRKVIAHITNNTHSLIKSNVFSPEVIQQAGDELSQIAIDNPGNYLYGLQLLRDWINGKELDKRSLTFLQHELIKALPGTALSTGQKSVNMDPLAKTYLEILEQKILLNE